MKEIIPPYTQLPSQTHHNAKYMYIRNGYATLHFGDAHVYVQQGHVIALPAGTEYCLETADIPAYCVITMTGDDVKEINDMYEWYAHI